MSKPAHQGSKDSTEDSGGDEDSRVPFYPKVMCLSWTRGRFFDSGYRGLQTVDPHL
jgi:hypothetical protein